MKISTSACSSALRMRNDFVVVCDLRQLRGQVKKVKQIKIQFKISSQIENLLHESLQMCWCRLMILNIYKRFRPSCVGPDLDPI